MTVGIPSAANASEVQTYSETLSLGKSVETHTKTDSAPLAYGWRWQQPVVLVFDGTNDPIFKVSEAVREWDDTGQLNAEMTNNPALADIVVSVDNGMGYVGLASWTVENNVATYCDIKLNQTYNYMPKVQEHGTIHEFGHCFGLAHNQTDIKRSVMNTYVNSSTAVKAPSAYDYRLMKGIYS